MGERILITGGAGFIGSHLADELLAHGYEVRILDNLCEQVHGPDALRPAYLAPEAELVVGDVRDPAAVRAALQGADAVFHLTALVGVGQSMYQIRDYVDVNDTGTAVLLEALLDRPVRRMVVASSMSIYGEGLYRDADGGLVEDARRDANAPRESGWELRDASGRPLLPVLTPETKRPSLASVYALNKYAQEQLCHIVGQSYGIETTALRFFNVYGPRQALSNPYTGVLAIFASRLLNDRPPMIFEDGRQRRDFVHVADVALACRLALERPEAAHQSFNVASGAQSTVVSLAQRLAEVMGKDIAPEITGKRRKGDIRHCFADISKAQAMLGFQPRVPLDHGLAEFADWLAGQSAHDRFELMSNELAGRGLTA